MKSETELLRAAVASGFVRFITADGAGGVSHCGGFSSSEPRPEDLLSLIDTSTGKKQTVHCRDFHYRAVVVSGNTVLLQLLENEPENAAHLRRIIADAVPDVVILKDSSGRWIMYNHAAEELRESSSLFSSSSPFLSPECSDSDKEAWFSESSFRQDEKLPDGRIYDVTKTVIMKPDGSRGNLLVLARDVTETRHREARLEALNQMFRIFRKVDQLILTCQDPACLLGEVAVSLARSGVFRSFAACSALKNGSDQFFIKVPEESVICRESFQRLEKASWSESLISGEELAETVPELKGTTEWAAARMCQGGNTCGYLIAESSVSHNEIPEASPDAILTHVASDLGRALRVMELSEARQSSARETLETRNMLESFMEYFPGPVFIRDSNSRYLKMNRELIRLFEGDHFLLQYPEDIYPADSAKSLRERDRKVLERGHLTETRTIGDGDEETRRAFEVHYFRIEGTPEPLIGGIALDITERLEADRALKKSESEYRAIYENTGTAMVTIDPGGIISSANANAVKLTGYTPREACGKMKWTRFVHPDDRARVTGRRRKRLKAAGSEVFDYEFRLLRKDGSIRHVRVHTGTIPNSSGTGVISISDITSLVDYQNQLKQSLEKNHAILKAIPDLVFVLTREGQYRNFFAGDENMLAFPADELVGRSIREIGLKEETVRKILRAISETIDTGTVHHVEYEIDLPEERHYYEAGISLFETDSVLVLCRDATDRKNAEREQNRLEAQMRHVQKLESLGILAGGIAHDFNNILMAITGNVHLARQFLEEESDSRKYLDSAEKAAFRASDLADQMLAYSGKGEFRRFPVDLNEVTRDISEILTATTSKKAELIYRMDPDAPMVLADGAQVRQVVMNLITNASEALEGKAGQIVISSGARFCDESYISTLNRTEKIYPGLFAWVQIDDTGRGMDEDTMEKIFDPFFTTKFTGRGLGLSAVLGIMRSHGGALHISSAQGKGSSFRALFPVPEGSGDGEEEPAARAKEYTGSGTVLFVDDEPDVRLVGAEILSSMGFDVVTGSDGLEGLALFKEHIDSIALVILDLTMPGMDGDEVFREIKKLSSGVPIIVSSGYNESEIFGRFSGCPPEVFVKKPYTAEELRNKIAFLMGG